MEHDPKPVESVLRNVIYSKPSPHWRTHFLNGLAQKVIIIIIIIILIIINSEKYIFITSHVIWSDNICGSVVFEVLPGSPDWCGGPLGCDNLPLEIRCVCVLVQLRNSESVRLASVPSVSEMRDQYSGRSVLYEPLEPHYRMLQVRRRSEGSHVFDLKCLSWGPQSSGVVKLY